jgi:hypothetical protein
VSGGNVGIAESWPCDGSGVESREFQLPAPDALFGKRRAPPSELGLEVFKQIGLKMQFHGCLASRQYSFSSPWLLENGGEIGLGDIVVTIHGDKLGTSQMSENARISLWAKLETQSYLRLSVAD